MTRDELAKKLYEVNYHPGVYPLWEDIKVYHPDGSITKSLDYLYMADFILANFVPLEGYKKYEGFIDMYANPKGYIFYYGSKPDDWGGNETKQAILLIKA